eukprot:9488995-Pyramimonas_sp.AAC.2
MNQSEFSSNIGKPQSRMPAVPTLDVVNETTGEKEEVYVFEHPILKHRTLTMTASVYTEATNYHLAAGGVTHDGHTERTFKKAMSEVTDNNAKTAENLMCGKVKAPRLDDYRMAFCQIRAAARVAGLRPQLASLGLLTARGSTEVNSGFLVGRLVPAAGPSEGRCGAS